jgi:hypothetical protein
VAAIEIWKGAYDLASIRRLHELAHLAPDELARHNLHSGDVTPHVQKALEAADVGADSDLSILVAAVRSVEAEEGQMSENVAQALDNLEAYATVAAAINRLPALDGVPPLVRVLQWAKEAT